MIQTENINISEVSQNEQLHNPRDRKCFKISRSEQKTYDKKISLDGNSNSNPKCRLQLYTEQTGRHFVGTYYPDSGIN